MLTKKVETNYLNYLILFPDDYNPEKSYSVIILLHGYGANMSDLSTLAPAINSSEFIYIFPNAPLEFDIGINVAGYAWFPIESGDYKESAKLLDETLKIALNGINQNKIFLGGFSQGGMMAIHSGLFSENYYDGIIILSSKLINDEIKLSKNLPENTKIFISHGIFDTVLSIEEGEKINNQLSSLGFSTSFKKYNIAHEINLEVINDLSEWLMKI
tara:strand:- start:172 stop:816 length:645 start_codon:yes stop_codon:yes gene_type:complete